MKKPRYTQEGLPIDGRDWAEDDWRELHEAVKKIKARVAARHLCHYCKGQHPPQDWCPQKRAAWEASGKKT